MNYDFKEGDKVEVVRIIFTDEEWVGSGEVNVPFKLGDVLTIKEVFSNEHKPIKVIEHIDYYPKEAFIPYNKSDKDYKYLIPIIEKLNKDYV